jgi:2-iminobutanoate/2-iminopropanoate deaminase
MANGFNPAGMWGPNARAFSQGVIQGDGVVIHVTGQVAWDEKQNVVGAGDIRVQMQTCIENIKTVLAAVGGTLDDIVSLAIYFLNRQDLPAIQEVRARHFTVGTAPVSILLQVPGLVLPEFLIELVPIAVVPHARFKRPT